MWLWLALSAPLFFAITGFLDKYLLTKVTAGASAGAFTVVSGVVALPFAVAFGLWAGGDIASVTLAQAGIGFASGAVVVWSYYYYYRALRQADASLVYAIFQLTVGFNYLFGRVFLGENITSLQAVAIFLILVGSIGLTAEHRAGKWRLKIHLLLLLIASTLLCSAGDVLFKLVALETGFAPAQFYNYLAYAVVSVLFLFLPLVRRNFFKTIKHHGPIALLGSGANELIYLVGLLLANYALLLAPIVMVQAVLSIDSLYMVIIGALLTYFFPKIIKENISGRRIKFKLSLIAVIITGMVLLVV